MQFNLPKDTKAQSLSAGYARVAQYVHSLILRDRERLAIEQGVQAMKDGRVEDCDRDFRQKHSVFVSNGHHPRDVNP